MGGCIFCSIVSGDVGGERLHETEDLVVIKDKFPQAPTHLLVITKKHYRNIIECVREDAGLAGEMVRTAVQVAEKFGFSESGFRTVINTNAGGGQTVFHMHMHILSGTKLSEKMV